jgi:hypothetical protein
VLVGYVVALSALVLALQRLYRTRTAKSLRARVFGLEKPPLNDSYVPKGGYVARHGGSIILGFQFVRCLANVGLVALALASYSSDHNDGAVFVTAAAVSQIQYLRWTLELT